MYSIRLWCYSSSSSPLQTPYYLPHASACPAVISSPTSARASLRFNTSVWIICKALQQYKRCLPYQAAHITALFARTAWMAVSHVLACSFDICSRVVVKNGCCCESDDLHCLTECAWAFVFSDFLQCQGRPHSRWCMMEHSPQAEGRELVLDAPRVRACVQALCSVERCAHPTGDPRALSRIISTIPFSVCFLSEGRNELDRPGFSVAAPAEGYIKEVCGSSS